jgi:hypothetical protein
MRWNIETPLGQHTYTGIDLAFFGQEAWKAGNLINNVFNHQMPMSCIISQHKGINTNFGEKTEKLRTLAWEGICL